MTMKSVFCNYVLSRAIFFVALTSSIFPAETVAADSGAPVCSICRGRHYDSEHNGGSSPPVYVDPPPVTVTGPSPHQLKMQKLRKDSNAANDKGVEYFNKGDYDTALQYFEEALRINRNNIVAKQNMANAFNQKGVEYDNNGDYENAVKYYEKAVIEFPGSDPDIIKNLDQAKERLRNVRETTLRIEEEVQIRRKEDQRDLILSGLKETTSVTAGDQLISVEIHGLVADKLSSEGTIYNFKLERASMEARKVFDDDRGDKGEWSLVFRKDLGKNPWRESVVTNEDRERAPVIIEYERKRHEARERRLQNEEKLEDLKSFSEGERPKDWSVQVAAANQDISNADNEEIFYNFQINVTLKKSKIPK